MIGHSNLFKLGLLVLFSFSMILWGCDSDQEGTDGVEDEVVEEGEVAVKEADSKHYILPSPFELAALIRKANTNYTKELLNPVSSIGNYTDNYKKALNLGVYGADLGYTLMYNQSQDGVDYLNVCKNLANELGIIGAFEASTIGRVEQNIDNQDSLITIAAMTFSRSDMYLKEHERFYTSSLILSGGWIEALYIAAQVAETTSNEAIIDRIGEQKISLDLLIAQLKKFEGEEETVVDLINDLTLLQEIYSGVSISYEYKKTTIDTSSRISVINSTSTVNVSNESLNNIIGHISTVRSKIID